MQVDAVTGIILAGGLSRRMGGCEKALQDLCGVSLLGRAADAIRPQCAELILSANGDARRFAEFGLPVIADTLPGYPGPLAGILAGLDWIAAHRPGIKLAISVPSDTPFLPSDLVARLLAARSQEKTTVACARSGGRLHPVVALWPVAVRGDLRHALTGGEVRKAEAFLRGYSCAIADWPAGTADPFFNVNDRRDLEAAHAILRARQQPLA
jgi:molybdopterin-guanine dinucleotide biosynthesis protein A